MIVLASILSSFSLLMSVLLLIRVHNPLGWATVVPKMIAGALSPFWAIMGVAGAVLGGVYGALWAIPIGIVGAVIMVLYVYRCTRQHDGFEKAFGADWKSLIDAGQARHMVKRRQSIYLKMKASPKPSFERDLAFWTVPETERELLCDVWSPVNGNHSGLGIVFLHGGGWSIFDKDFGTRPFFNHLVAQGHTVMDVAYRLCPEVDIFGMVGDAKRAVAWMKANADRYGVNPDQVVLGGASAGGHLALLAGYTPRIQELTPAELDGADLSVCGVFSYYGPTDLHATFEYENQHIFAGYPPARIGEKLKSTNRLNLDPQILRFYAGRLDLLLGGFPQDVPEIYELASPVTHVQQGSPPTLLVQGQQDFITPVDATCALHNKLVESGVPSVNIVFPWTDHGFDLLIPQVSLPTQSALYDLDRFLALLVSKKIDVQTGASEYS
jgi:acetyl esterase/lipase